MAIQSFGDKTTEVFFVTGRVKKGVGWLPVKAIAKRKLDMVHYAFQLNDLKAPPGNRLEALRGKYSGYHSIRVNDQWGIVFQWTSSGPQEVQIIDYH